MIGIEANIHNSDKQISKPVWIDPFAHTIGEQMLFERGIMHAIFVGALNVVMVAISFCRALVGPVQPPSRLPY